MKALLAAAVLVASLGAPALADHDRFLTVTGDGTGYVDVRFDTDVLLDPQLTTYRTTGTVVGFYVRRIGAARDERPAVGMTARGFRTMGSRTTQPVFEPGAYRVYLVSDGRASVRILARGLERDVTARVRHRRPLTLNVGPVDVRPDSALRYRGERTTRLRGGNTVLMTAYDKRLPDDGPATWGSISTCIEAHQACDDTTAGYVPTNSFDRASGYGWSWHHPGDVDRTTVVHQAYAGTARADVRTLALELVL